jgi:hypothetical protein
MARVDVSPSELRAAFYSFRRHAPDASNNKCCCLDILYAVECGISVVLLRERQENSTNFLKDLVPNHNINALLELCKNPPFFRLPSRINLSKNRSIPHYSVSHADLHSVLRYGAKIPDAEWKKCAAILINISKWIIINIEGR